MTARRNHDDGYQIAGVAGNGKRKREASGVSNYDLSHITEVVKSGWTGDIYVSNDDMLSIPFDSNVTFAGEDLYTKIMALIADWDCEETEDGGVLVYTKPGSEEVG